MYDIIYSDLHSCKISLEIRFDESSTNHRYISLGCGFFKAEQEAQKQGENLKNTTSHHVTE